MVLQIHQTKVHLKKKTNQSEKSTLATIQPSRFNVT